MAIMSCLCLLIRKLSSVSQLPLRLWKVALGGPQRQCWPIRPTLLTLICQHQRQTIMNIHLTMPLPCSQQGHWLWSQANMGPKPGDFGKITWPFLNPPVYFTFPSLWQNIQHSQIRRGGVYFCSQFQSIVSWLQGRSCLIEGYGRRKLLILQHPRGRERKGFSGARIPIFRSCPSDSPAASFYLLAAHSTMKLSNG